MSDTVKNYIRSLDATRDISLLSEAFPSVFGRNHFRLLYLMTELLQQGVQAQLSFYQLGMLICRRYVSQPSPLEQLWEQHLQHSSPVTEEVQGLSQMDILTLRMIAQQAVARVSL